MTKAQIVDSGLSILRRGAFANLTGPEPKDPQGRGCSPSFPLRVNVWLGASNPVIKYHQAAD